MKIKCKDILSKEIKLLEKKVKNSSFKNMEVAILLTMDNLDSIKYIQRKKEILEAIGIKVVLKHDSKIEKREVINWLEYQNNRKECVGIIIQYPIEIMKRNEVKELIVFEKDIDALSSHWMNKLASDNLTNNSLIPPTALATEMILKQQKRFLKRGQRVLVIGDSVLTGRPISLNLMNKGFTVSVVDEDSNISDINNLAAESDIIISTVGKKNVVDEARIQAGAIVIDFGRYYENNLMKGSITIKELEDGIDFTALYNSTGDATIAALLHNINRRV